MIIFALYQSVKYAAELAVFLVYQKANSPDLIIQEVPRRGSD